LRQAMEAKAMRSRRNANSIPPRKPLPMDSANGRRSAQHAHCGKWAEIGEPDEQPGGIYSRALLQSQVFPAACKAPAFAIYSGTRWQKGRRCVVSIEKNSCASTLRGKATMIVPAPGCVQSAPGPLAIDLRRGETGREDFLS
jgi:hypothetical protein